MFNSVLCLVSCQFCRKWIDTKVGCTRPIPETVGECNLHCTNPGCTTHLRRSLHALHDALRQSDPRFFFLPYSLEAYFVPLCVDNKANVAR